MKIKEWFINKIEEKSSIYGLYIDLEHREDNLGYKHYGEDNSYVWAYTYGDILEETEKAVKVTFSTGATVGSSKGWTTWVPKSVIAD